MINCELFNHIQVCSLHSEVIYWSKTYLLVFICLSFICPSLCGVSGVSQLINTF